MKEYLMGTTVLSKPVSGKHLFLYLAVSRMVISSTLVRDDNGIQCPVYYISRALVDAEKHYLIIEKLALSMLMAS